MRRWLWSFAAAVLLSHSCLAGAAATLAPPASAADMAPAKLDELLAPIALYPDALVGQILAASSNPQEVLDGGNWLLEHTSLKGQALQDEAIKAGFGPSMQALVQFPTVVDMMCSNFDWTKQLGSVFNTDQAAVLASIQRLRAQAQAIGNLKTTPQQQVVTTTESGQQVIVIQPADPKVIYVPTYPPTTVYTQPVPVQTGPTSGDVAAAAFFGFFAGVVVHSIISDSYYPYPRWGYGGFYYGGRPYGGNTYVYAPHYNYGGYRPGYGPGYGYHPPPNYPNSWNRPNNNGNFSGNRGSGNTGNRVGNNTTININNSNNNNYFNRFENNANRKPGAQPPQLVSDQVRNRPDAYRPTSSQNKDRSAGGATNRPASLPGNGNASAGARPAAAGQGNRPATSGSTTYNKPGLSDARDRGYPNSTARPGNAATRDNKAAPGADRTARPASVPGSSGLDRQSAFGGASARPAPASTPQNRASAPQSRPSAPQTRPAPAPSNRAAEQRGRSSVGNGGTKPMNAHPHGGR